MSDDELDLKPSASAASTETNLSCENFTSAARKKKKQGEIFDLQGIDTKRPNTFIARDGLVTDALQKTRKGRILVVGSPPGTGKTSLSQLLQEKLRIEKDESQKRIKGFYLRPTNSPDDLFQWVEDKTGISFRNQELRKDLNEYSEVWLLFDDAQMLYDETKYGAFWDCIVKQKRQLEIAFGETAVYVVVFATYYLSGSPSSPYCFIDQERLSASNLLFTKDEAAMLFNRRCMHPEWQDYFERLFYMTKGAGAPFTVGMNCIVDSSNAVDRRSHEEELSESMALMDFVEKTPFEKLKRCFGTVNIDAASHRVILDALVTGYDADIGEIKEDEELAKDEAVLKVIKAGILDKTLRFASPIAERFYYRMIFPGRSQGKEPETLDELVTEATRTLSATRLRNAREEDPAGGYKSPKEAVYQQLFHEAMSSVLSIGYRIIPELGTKATIDGKVVSGELDFYIVKAGNGRRWALEFLRDRDRLPEHLRRMPGKYKDVPATRWLVVDCEAGSRVPNRREENLCTLVFQEDFRSCTFYMRLQDPFEYPLQE